VLYANTIYFWVKVVRVMDEVESTFTKHFTNNDRKRAMKFLRPQQQPKASHMITFLVGNASLIQILFSSQLKIYLKHNIIIYIYIKKYSPLCYPIIFCLMVAASLQNNAIDAKILSVLQPASGH